MIPQKSNTVIFHVRRSMSSLQYSHFYQISVFILMITLPTFNISLLLHHHQCQPLTFKDFLKPIKIHLYLYNFLIIQQQRFQRQMAFCPNNTFMQQQKPLYFQRNQYPKRSPYIEQNFKNFGKGLITSILPIKNQLHVHQTEFYSRNNQGLSQQNWNNSLIESTQYNCDQQPQYVFSQVPDKNVADQEDRCFCCLGSIRQSEQVLSNRQDFYQGPQIQIQKGQKLLTSHELMLKNLEKERIREQNYQKYLSECNIMKNRQQQSSLSKYFNIKQASSEQRNNQIEQQEIEESSDNNTCSECYRRICRQCRRICQECQKVVCKFDLQDESVESKHRCA